MQVITIGKRLVPAEQIVFGALAFSEAGESHGSDALHHLQQTTDCNEQSNRAHGPSVPQMR